MNSAAVPILALAVLAAASAAAIAHAPQAAHAQDGAAMSIQEMVDNAEAGATVIVPPGTYADEAIAIAKPLTLASGQPGAAVLTGNSSIAVRQGQGGPVTVSGLVFRDIACPAGGPGGGAVVAVGPGAGDGTPGMVSIRGNTFDGTCAAAVAAAPASSDLTVTGNTFRGIGAAAPNGSAPPPAVRLGEPASDSLVSSNYMFDLRGAAVQASGARGLSVVDNHVENAGSSAVVVASGSSGVRVVGNTIIGAAAPALAVWADSSGALLVGNRISESAGALHVCAASCEPGGASADVGNPIRFHHNTLHASNTGDLIGGDAGPGAIDARSNYYPSYAPDSSRLAGAAGSATAMPAGSAPARIGALLAATDLPYFDGVANDAAVLEAAVRFSLAQVESGGNLSVEIVRADLRLADPNATVSALADGKDDARYRPILASQIDSMRAAIDGQGRDAAVAAVRAMDSPQEHYPFILNRTGHVQANGANPDRVDVVSPIASGDNPVPFDGFLVSLDAAPPGAAMWYDYRISNFVHEGQPIESKRSLLSLHGLGTEDPSDDLILGAGYYPRPLTFMVGPSASSSIANVSAYASAAGLVLVSPSSLSPELAMRDSVYRMAPNDGLRAFRIAEVVAGDGADRDIVAIVQDDEYGNAAYGRIGAAYEALSQGSVMPKVPFSASIGAGEWGPVVARANEMVLASAAADPPRSAAVLYIGFDPPFAGAAAEAMRYPALAGAQWYSTDLAGSPVVTGGAAPLDLALSTNLKAVVFGVEPNDATRAVDAAIAARPGGGDAGDPRTAYAYAAHDAVLLIGGALAAGHSTQDAFAANLQGLAAAGLRPGGALGSIAFDDNGDLYRPGTFSTWEVSPGAGRWTITETAAPSLSCGASLASDSLDLGSVELGQAGEMRRQVLANAGSAPMTGIVLNATEWSSGLPAGTTLFAAAAADGGSGASGQLSQASTLLGGDDAAIAPNSSIMIDYRLDLRGMSELPPGASDGGMEQIITYELSCD